MSSGARRPVPQPPSRVATVLAADAAGYSRAMSLDETRALAALAASRQVIDHLIEAWRGRIFSTGGDSVLAEFPSGDDAVRCGAEIQGALRRAGEAGREVLTYRIGIHLGHVYSNGDDLLGETVNIAARLESLANPGGLCISDRVRDALGALPEFVLEDLGAQFLKGISSPTQVTRIRRGEPDQTAPASRISLAVLPFLAEAKEEHWGEGLADDLIAALSRFGTLAVLARASSFPLRGVPDPRRIASVLDVRFVVTGSVRMEGSRFRLSVQLLDGSSGVVVWADHYAFPADDLAAVQDRAVEQIVGILVGRLEQSGASKALRKRTESLGAFDLLLRGLHHADRVDPASARSAADCFERALTIDPDYPAALAMLALMRLRSWALAPGDDDLAAVTALSARALALDPADSWCHLVAGQIAMYRKALDLAEIHHKKAHALNPYDARIVALRSPLATYLGKPEEGRMWIEQAMRLNPYHPAWYETNLGLACYGARHYAEGAAVYASVAAPHIGVLAGLVACRAQLGDRAGAAAARATLLGLAPEFSSKLFLAMRPFKFEVDSDHLLDGLRQGDLPE